MSIFDKNTPLPEEQLYDTCREICNSVIPRNMTHYHADKKFMKNDIIGELKHRGLFHEPYPDNYDASYKYKICHVEVQIWDYPRLIPRYRVWFYYISKERMSSLGSMFLESSYLTDFIVSINGVEGNGPM